MNTTPIIADFGTLVSGSSPRTAGAFYDVAYDRSLDPPAKATGNGVSAGTCTPGSAPTGTRTEYEEGIDLDQTQLNGGAPGGLDGGKASIDPAKLPRDPKHGCAPVFPWNFVRTNTIFGVIHAAGGYTAWSDKHPASFTSGHFARRASAWERRLALGIVVNDRIWSRQPSCNLE